MPLNLRMPSECHLDVLTFGECMIRLSPPGHQRIEFTIAENGRGFPSEIAGRLLERFVRGKKLAPKRAGVC